MSKLSSYQKVKSFRKRLKEKAVAYKGGRCSLCRYSKCLEALVFHHLDPSQKDFAISTSSKAFENIKDELDKCVLLCNRCHSEVHAGIILLPGSNLHLTEVTITHGSLTAYYHYKCRCDLCKSEYRQYKTELDERKGIFKKKRAPNVKNPECGSTSKYQKGCRCTDCKNANTAYAREYKKRKNNTQAR